jgi:hypothetical protein
MCDEFLEPLDLPDVGKLVLFPDEHLLGASHSHVHGHVHGAHEHGHRKHAEKHCENREPREKREKHEEEHTKVIEKKGKNGKDGCRGCPGRPGPVAETIVFGAQSLETDGGLVPFYLLPSSNELTGIPLDFSSPLTAPYADLALTSTNKMIMGVSINGDNTPATVTVTVTVSSPNLPITNAFSISRVASKPFTLIPNIDFNVAAGYIVYVSVDPGSALPAAVTGVDVMIQRYIG